jgi:hypothetical protein
MTNLLIDIFDIYLMGLGLFYVYVSKKKGFFSFLNYIKENHTIFKIVNLLYVVTSNRLHCLIIDFSEQTARTF